MRIAISADDANGLSSVCSAHFGRCPFFALVDVAGLEVQNVEMVANPFFANHQPGQVPAFVHSLRANVMLTGGMGGRAITFFQQYGIEPVTGAAGTVRHALEAYLAGTLTDAAACSESASHHEAPPPGEYEKDDLERLREEVTLLRDQLEDAEKRLGGLSER